MGKKIYLLVYLDDAFGKADKGCGGQGGFDERLGLERGKYYITEEMMQIIEKDPKKFLILKFYEVLTLGGGGR